jgi:RNA polymerase sigma-70 factor (ECF subfamily)
MRQRPGRCDFESVVRTESTRVFAAAHRILRDRGKAEDVMQEVFLGVVQGRIGLDEAADPGAVLAWWAAKSALSTLRSEKRRLVREEAGAMAHAGPSAAVSDQDALALWAEVAELPEPLAQAVWAKFQDGKTLSALATAAGVSVTTAHARVNKGLEELRTRLASAGGVTLLPRLEAILASAPAATPSAAAVSSLLALGSAAPAAAMSPVGALCAMLLLGTVVGAAVWIESPPSLPVSSAPGGVAMPAPDLGSRSFLVRGSGQGARFRAGSSECGGPRHYEGGAARHVRANHGPRGRRKSDPHQARDGGRGIRSARRQDVALTAPAR